MSTFFLLSATIFGLLYRFATAMAIASKVALPCQPNQAKHLQSMFTSIRGRLLVLSFLLFLNHNSYSQFNIPDVKTLKEQTSVYDYAKLFSEQEFVKLRDKLLRYSDSTSTQMVVITIDELKGEDIGVLAPKWAHAWGIGQEKEDNGLLVLIAKNDRKVWIAPGYGIEEVLTAGQSGQIIRSVMVPNFKNGNYYKGVNDALDIIKEMLLGRYKNQPKAAKRDGGLFPVFLFLIFMSVIVYLSLKYGDKNPPRGGSNSSGGGLSPMDIIILSSLGRGGRSSGGFGGGSFGGGGFGGGFSGGFGGGGFSGGGAGGSW
ncbi:MAG: TPM domain-containing protein [Flavobacterium sp.]